MTLGEIIRQFRQEHDLSQRQFAMRCGLSNGYIAMLEKNMNPKTGKPISVSLENLHDIASAMNMTADELMRMADGNTRVSMGETSNTPEEAPDPSIYIVTRGMEKMSDDERSRMVAMARAAFPDIFKEGFK